MSTLAALGERAKGAGVQPEKNQWSTELQPGIGLGFAYRDRTAEASDRYLRPYRGRGSP